MDALKRAILKKGRVKEGQILKVDSFLNHQIDIDLLNEIGREFYRRFEGAGVTKILTIEASGIAIAAITAQYFHVPVLFAKKTKTKNIDGDVYAASVFSYTRGMDYDILVSSRFLTSADTVLIIDDFLAKGSALAGLAELTRQAGASLAGAGIVIEKSFDTGAARIRGMGVRVESLARIGSMEGGSITFA